MTYELKDIMTISEASELYNININTLKNKFKPSIVGQEKIDYWCYHGLIRQSAKVWLITPEFIELNFKKGEF